MDAENPVRRGFTDLLRHLRECPLPTTGDLEEEPSAVFCGGAAFDDYAGCAVLVENG